MKSQDTILEKNILIKWSKKQQQPNGIDEQKKNG